MGEIISVEFFQKSLGSEPVREWLKSLPINDKKIIGHDIKVVEFGWPLGMPRIKNMGKGIWEIRSNLTSNRIARVLFCIEEGQMILLHGFIKKTQKTAKPDIELAHQRKKQLKRNK